MDLAPDATLADLRAELQRELPALHEVKLFGGLRELADDCQVEIELQSVTVPIPGHGPRCACAQSSRHLGWASEANARCSDTSSKR